MSLPELPNDMAEWPADPFRLLGLTHTSRSSDAKQAYRHLIKTFKPEQRPAEFRRIRDAYETVLSWCEEREDDRPEPQLRPIATPESQANDNPPAGSPAHRKSRSPPSFANSLPEAWNEALQGNLASAYRSLADLADGNLPGGSVAMVDHYIRMYWLLYADPRLDSKRSRIDWLLKAVRASGTSSSAYQLLRRELQSDPHLAVGQQFENLLEISGSQERVADLAAWRWHAADQMMTPDQLVAFVASDVAQLRTRLSTENQSAWFRLLLSAADFTIWWHPPGSDETCNYVRELESMQHLHFQHDAELTRLDMLIVLAADWKQLASLAVPSGDGKVFGQLQNIVRRAWREDDYLTGAESTKLLSWIARDPHSALEVFDRVAEKSRSRLQLPQGNRREMPDLPLLRWMYQKWTSATDSDWPLDAERSEVQQLELFAHHGRGFLSPEMKRAALLELCLEHNIVVDRFAGFVPDQWRSDLPLKAVVAAYQCFWSIGLGPAERLQHY